MEIRGDYQATLKEIEDLKKQELIVNFDREKRKFRLENSFDFNPIFDKMKL